MKVRRFRNGETKIKVSCRDISIYLGILTLTAVAILVWSIYGCAFECIKVFPSNQ